MPNTPSKSAFEVNPGDDVCMDADVVWPEVADISVKPLKGSVLSGWNIAGE